jgi:hydroxymethylglutaryl-CoA lyase
MQVALALGTSFGCPFEGEVPFERVLELIAECVNLGVISIELADTIGAADPQKTATYFTHLRKKYPDLTLQAHLHDTRNNGILNSYIAWESGVDLIHTALGGLGGCPYAPGASGNTCTEDLVWLVNRSGIDTGIDFEKIINLAKNMRSRVQGQYSGHQITLETDPFKQAPKEGGCKLG